MKGDNKVANGYVLDIINYRTLFKYYVTKDLPLEKEKKDLRILNLLNKNGRFIKGYTEQNKGMLCISLLFG